MHAQLEYFPEQIAALGPHQSGFSSRCAMLIAEQYATRDEACLRQSFEQGQLMIERAGQTQIVVVEKGDEVSSAFE